MRTETNSGNVSSYGVRTSSLLILFIPERKEAITAGEIRLKYDIPIADSLIAETGVVENVKHILTDDEHFDATRGLIKPIDCDEVVRYLAINNPKFAKPYIF